MGCVSSKLFRKELENETRSINNNRNNPSHVVSLTSSTYGVLNLDKRNQQEGVKDSSSSSSSSYDKETKPEVINTWELMEGLEEDEAEEPKPVKKSPRPRSILLKGFGESPVKFLSQIGSPRKSKTVGGGGGKENRGANRVGSSPASSAGTNYYTPRPVLKARNVREGDSGTTTTRKKAVMSLSFDKKQSGVNPVFDPEMIESYEKELVKVKCPPGGENSVVVYTTTLRGIRKTFEDCNRVRSVILSHPIRFVERDVSMDSGFREELRGLVGSKEVRVPLLFVKGKVVGGAEEVIKLEEEGKLGILFEGVPKRSGGGEGGGCGRCAGFGFVMCGGCNGSCKVMDEKEKKVVRCGLCNENGLVKCFICSC